MTTALPADDPRTIVLDALNLPASALIASPAPSPTATVGGALSPAVAPWARALELEPHDRRWLRVVSDDLAYIGGRSVTRALASPPAWRELRAAYPGATDGALMLLRAAYTIEAARDRLAEWRRLYASDASDPDFVAKSAHLATTAARVHRIAADHGITPADLSAAINAPA